MFTQLLLCVYMHIYTFIYVYICMYIYICYVSYIYIYIINTYIYIYIRMYIYMYISICIHMCIYTCVCMCKSLYSCIHMYRYIYTYIHCTYRVYIYIHTYIHPSPWSQWLVPHVKLHRSLPRFWAPLNSPGWSPRPRSHAIDGILPLRPASARNGHILLPRPLQLLGTSVDDQQCRRPVELCSQKKKKWWVTSAVKLTHDAILTYLTSQLVKLCHDQFLLPPNIINIIDLAKLLEPSNAALPRLRKVPPQQLPCQDLIPGQKSPELSLAPVCMFSPEFQAWKHGMGSFAWRCYTNVEWLV